MTTKLKKYAMPLEVVAQKDIFGRKILRYQASFEGLSVTGQTADEAATKLRSALSRMIGRTQDLLVVRWRDLTLLIRFEPVENHWVVSRLDPPSSPEVPDAQWLSTNYAITHELEKAKERVGHRPMRTVIEQIALQDIIKHQYRASDGPRIPVALPDMDLKELANWVEFQIRYATARDRGYPEERWADYAGRNPAYREIWGLEPQEEFKLVQG